MFRKIRRREKQLSNKDCNDILKKAEYGTIATMGQDKYPYAVPVNFVYHNGNIYFHCAKTGHKLDNIHYCSNVSFNVVTDVFVVPLIPKENFNSTELKFNGFDTNFNSVVIFGKAVEISGEEKIDSLHVLFKKFLNVNDYNKYREAGIKYIEKSLNRTKVIKIEIVHMSGKRGVK
jgi:nitroimidazol reductase NimA-like FMN-containing flavoprotein (pyridoxamine 5'-phosphate oxidase superfamily)